MNNSGVVLRPDIPGLWMNEWSLPYESLFCRLWKYAWANSANAAEITRSLLKMAPSSLSTPQPRELLYCEWVSSDRAGLLAREDRCVGIAAEFGEDWMWRLGYDLLNLRYCRDCLAEGFHTLLFHIAALKACPLHGIPLTHSCTNCGKPSPALSLWTPSFKHPFYCNACEHPLAGELRPQKWVTSSKKVDDVESAFGPLARWMNSLPPIPYKHDRPPLSQLCLAGQFASESKSVVSFEIAKTLRQLELPDSLFSPSCIPFRVYESRPPPAEEPDSLFNPWDCFRSLWNAFESLSQELLATVLKGHCRAIEAAELGVTCDYAMAAVFQRPGLCPLAAGFVRWQQRVIRSRRQFSSGDQLPVTGREFAAVKHLAIENLKAQFYSDVATSYVYEVLLKDRDPREVECDDRYKALMNDYSRTQEDPNALWKPYGDPDRPDGAEWLVGPDPKLASPEAFPTICRCRLH